MEAKKQNEIINRELVIENNVLMENLQKANEKVKNIQDDNQKLKNENQELKNRVKELEDRERQLQEELDKIIYSRSYKLIQKVKKIIQRG